MWRRTLASSCSMMFLKVEPAMTAATSRLGAQVASIDTIQEVEDTRIDHLERACGVVDWTTLESLELEVRCTSDISIESELGTTKGVDIERMLLGTACSSSMA